MADTVDESMPIHVRNSRDRFKRVTDPLQLTPDESGNGFSFVLPGFKYDDFNRAGIINFTKICKYFEFVRSNFWSASGIDSSSLQMAYMVGMHIEISDDFYQTASMSSEMRIVAKLSSIGKSSFSYHLTLTNEDSGQVMASMFRELVHIGAKTRKPEPFDPNFRQTVNRILEGFQLRPPSRLVLPSVNRQNCYSCKIRVLNIDMDIYYHTTQLKYVDYALECAAQATESGYYKRLKKDICNYCVKKSSFVHLGESHAGDELLVMTWEDQLNPLLLYFVVTNNGKDICQAKMEFYDPYVYSNL
jgi:acyl-CoA thioesterase FadM